MIVPTNFTRLKNSQQRIGSAFLGQVICSVDKELVSKETVVLRRWGSGDECLVLSTELIR